MITLNQLVWTRTDLRVDRFGRIRRGKGDYRFLFCRAGAKDIRPLDAAHH